MSYIRVLASSLVFATIPCAMGQTMTFNAVLDDPDARIGVGQTIRVDIFAEWAPPELGMAGVFFDIINEENFDLGTVNFSEAFGLGRNPSLRVDGGQGQVVDADGDQDADIAGIQAFQQGPVFNPGFNDANPILLFSFDWTAPLQPIDTYDVTVSLDVADPYPRVWNDSFVSTQYAAGPLEITWQVEPPPDRREITGDGVINLVDVAEVLVALGTSSGEFRYNPLADFDQDNTIGLGDVLFLRAAAEKTCPNVSTVGLPTANFVSLVPVDNSSVGAGVDPDTPEFDGGSTHYTFDLVLDLPATDDWLGATMRAEVTHNDCDFFFHPRARTPGYAPAAADIPFAPASQYASFPLAASEPALGKPGSFPMLLGERSQTSDEICVTWFDAKTTTGDVVTIARITVATDGSVSGTVGSVAGVLVTGALGANAHRYDLPIEIP